jgi:hypothetical protein
MNFVVAINKPSRIGNGKIVLDLPSAVRIHAGETDVRRSQKPHLSPLWTGTTP